MKGFGRPRLWISLCSLLIVVLAAVVDSDRAAPGALTTVHGRIPELAESGSCSLCHGGWFSNMTDGCLECHETTQQDIETSHGLHGSMDQSEALACARCHSEHHGPAFAMVNAQTFARSGIDEPADFDHVLVGFIMDGAHDELTCNECHENADVDVLPAGAARFGGLEQRCDACHEPAHEERLSNDCAACHDQRGFSEPNPAGHDRSLPLVGGHGALSCRDCHDVAGSHRLGLRAKANRSCADCHDTPHDLGFSLTADHGPAVDDRLDVLGNACLACHLENHESFAAARDTLTDAQHVSTGFALTAPHEDVGCAGCHDELSEPYEARFLGRAQRSCQLCHEDPHGGQFAGRIPEERQVNEQPCLACHQQDAFEPTLFDGTRHQQTAFPLSGRHLGAECTACHKPAEDTGVRRFVQTPSRCDSCHDDSHRDAFAAADDCSQCHDTTGFERAAGDGFDHDRWTGFALNGAHHQASCESCHPREATADAQGRSFGRIADHVSHPRSCGSCHGDPHEQRYNGAHLPAEVGGRGGCLRCHTASSFRSLRDDYDHGLWTGFDLVGHHAAADCSSCHESQSSSSSPMTGHKNWGAPAGKSCANCHDSPHAGQFGTGAAASCERCHAGADGFDQLSFDHDKDSRFPLTETHAALACDACHDAVPSSTGPDVVRYQPLPIECVDCHGIHEDVLLLRRKGAR